MCQPRQFARLQLGERQHLYFSSFHTLVAPLSQTVLRCEMEVEPISSDASVRVPVEFQTRLTQVRELQDSQATNRAALFPSDNPVVSDAHIFDLHRITLDELAARLTSSFPSGLPEADAKERLLNDGPNRMSPPKSDLWRKILNYLFGGFCMILWPAAILCIIAWRPLGNVSPPAQIVNLALGIILLIDILVQAAFTAYQDWQSSRVMERIAQLVPSLVRVYRAENSGVSREISTEQLVVGDVIEINAGEKIGADVRLLEVHQLKVDQSILTGESLPVTLTIHCTSENPYESRNLAFLGTCCVEGSGKAVVIRTGDRTVMGQLAKTAAKAETKRTRLAREIFHLMVIISAAAGAVAVICFVTWLAWLRRDHRGFMSLPAAIITIVSAIVAFLPDGLPVAVTMAMTIIARRMAKQHVLVKQLITVETLGSVDMLASDKTGTLTRNKMAVTGVVLAGDEPHQGMQMYSTLATQQHKTQFSAFLSASTLCNGAHFTSDTVTSVLESLPNERVIVGDATDTAILRFVSRFVDPQETRAAWTELARIPFHSDRKWMAVICRSAMTTTAPSKPSVLLVLKGAPERIFERCETMLVADGRLVSLDTASRESFVRAQENLAAGGARVLAVAQRVLTVEEASRLEFDPQRPELFALGSLCFLGLLSITDPPRPEALSAVRAFRAAGIRVMMVTGDHPTTAQAIARQVGIITSQKLSNTRETAENCAIVVTGDELLVFDEAAWDRIYKHSEIVFARTTPEQKLTIVREAQKRGHQVALTGDGVNDAAALKQADVGVAMGGGSAVAQEAARIVLQDDNIASVVTGIESGRLFYENLKKVILYLLPAGSWSELLPVLATVFLGLQQPLGSFHMIWICIVTDVFASLALIYEKPEADVMHRPPRGSSDRLVSWKLYLQAYAFIGMIESCTAFILFFSYFKSQGISPSQLLLAFESFRGEDKWGNWTDSNWTTLPPTSLWPNTTREQCKCFPGYSNKQLTEYLYTAQTIFFVALVIQQFGNLFATRTRHLSLFQHQPFYGPTSNPYLFGSIVLSLGMALLVVYLPFFHNTFHTRSIPWQYWFLPLIGAVSVFLFDETRKWLVRTFPNGPIARIAW